MLTRKPSRGLGKGLSALFDDLNSETSGASDSGARAEIIYLNPQQFKTGLYQPRRHFSEEKLEELAQSIQEQGILHPLVARKTPEGDVQLVAGERRLRAAIKANLNEIPCRILPLTPKQALEISLLENVQRDDLSIIEEAQGYRHLLETLDCTQDALAKKLGKSRVHLTNLLRLLKLPTAVQTMIDTKQISAGHGRALVGNDHAEKLALLAQKEEWSVRTLENYLKQKKQPSEAQTSARQAWHIESLAAHDAKALVQTLSKNASENKDEEAALAAHISGLVGVKSRLALQKNNVVLSIHFDTLQKLDTFLQKITPVFLTPPNSSSFGTDAVDFSAFSGSLEETLNAPDSSAKPTSSKPADTGSFRPKPQVSEPALADPLPLEKQESQDQSCENSIKNYASSSSSPFKSA